MENIFIIVQYRVMGHWEVSIYDKHENDKLENYGKSPDSGQNPDVWQNRDRQNLDSI